MDSYKLLKRYIFEIANHLNEAAVNASSAVSEGMALLTQEHGNQKQYVLYNIENLKKRLDGDKNITVVFGMIEVWRHPSDEYDGASEVNKVVAEKGYGPLMYDIAMSDSENGLMPDRTGTKKAAQNVWHKYAARSDVKSVDIPDDILAGNMLIGDEVLDKRYIIQTPIQYSSLEQAHEHAMKEIAQTPADRKGIEHSIVSDALQFFSNRIS
jgi:hypothetical protein